ncbi:MAG: flagellar biosynthetic protein FliO [Burkholderiaceae bacterium]
MTSAAFTSALWFIAVLALIPLALWLVKRTPLGAVGSGRGAGAAGTLRHVAALPLSPSQRIVTVEVGSGVERRWLVLGVTPQSIQTLHSMAPQAEVPLPEASLPNFAQLFARLRKPGETS